MPNNQDYAQTLVNGILAVASPTDDGSGKFTLSKGDLGNLISNMERPKRPPSAFLLYKAENQQEFRDKNPGITKAGDLAKILATHYAELSDNEKDVYKEKYRVLKQEYTEKMRLHKLYFPEETEEKPKRKRGRPRKHPPVDSEVKKSPKKRGPKPKKPKNDVPQERVDTSDDEVSISDSRFTVTTYSFTVDNNDSDSDCDESSFERITNKDNGVEYSVDLKRGLYFDINTPWGNPLGTYDATTNTFN